MLGCVCLYLRLFLCALCKGTVARRLRVPNEVNNDQKVRNIPKILTLNERSSGKKPDKYKMTPLVLIPLPRPCGVFYYFSREHFDLKSLVQVRLLLCGGLSKHTCLATNSTLTQSE